MIARAGIAVALVVVAGCHFNPNAATGDGSGSSDGNPNGSDAGMDGSAGDGSGGTPSCISAWKSGSVTVTAVDPVDALNTSEDDRDPSLSADELTIYFSRFFSDGLGGGDKDVMVATRASVDAAFSTPAVLSRAVDTIGFDQSKFTVTGDGLYAIYAANDTLDDDLLITTRATVTDSFPAGDFTKITRIDDSKSQLDPEISKDGQDLYYANQPNSKQVISHSTLKSDGTWNSSTEVINSGAGDADPALVADGTIMLFSSNRSGSGDIYFVTRASTGDEFLEADANPVDVAGMVNDATASDGDPAITADGCHVFFASNRGGDDYDIFVATIQPE